MLCFSWISYFIPNYQLITNPRGAVKGLGGLVILGLVILISYSMSDGTLLNLSGYTADNNPATLKLLTQHYSLCMF